VRLTRLLVLLIALAACAKKKSASHDLDHDLIRVTSDARLRTDVVGGGEFTDTATFVLVEAENTAKEGAYVTLGGDLTDESGKVISTLRAASLYIPSGELRTFALVDKERKQRPEAKGAKIFVRGARVPPMPPPAHIEAPRQVMDGTGSNVKVVMQGILKNDAPRGGNIMVIATFFDEGGKPMTRPFSMIWVPPNGTQPVQFVGPPGSTKGTLFIGDVVY
jgi:hypothetical protein